MHWTEKRRAKAELGKALRDNGAHLFGWKDDHSDMMVDYWDPESWDGIATYKGYTIGCQPWTHRSGREDWPTFQETPKGFTWHIEKDGQIIAKGKGLNRCYYGYHWRARDLSAQDNLAREAADKLAKKILALIDKQHQNDPQEAPRSPQSRFESQVVFQDANMTIEYRGDWTWITFPAKPNQETRDILKEEGFRWSGKQGAWYKPERIDRNAILGEPIPEPPMISPNSPHRQAIERNLADSHIPTYRERREQEQ